MPPKKRDLSDSIISVRQQIADILPRVRHCAQVAPRINELASGIESSRGSADQSDGAPTPESMQAEINDLYTPFPLIQQQARVVLGAITDLLDRLPSDSAALHTIRAEIERLSFVPGPPPFFSFAKTNRDLEIIDGRLAEMLVTINPTRPMGEDDSEIRRSGQSDVEVKEMSTAEKERSKWTIVKNLGAGGQGFVELVTREGDSAEYVRKRLKNVESRERRRRFEDELRAYRELRHKNIVQLVDFEMESEGKQRPYIVTEYCQGGSLEDGKWRRGTIRQVLQDFLQVCDGLACAHDRGVIHRDIKPANIYLRSDGTIAVGDFGLCLFDDSGERLTATDEVAGSRWYCAPELGDGRLEGVRPSCDVYSLGKLLYWMLTGRVFDREKHRDEEWRIGRTDLPFPIYELVNQLLDRMIVADPWKRYQGAQVVAEAVRGLLNIEDAGGRAIGLGVPLLCTFCANGIYQWIADPFKNNERASTAAENFGVRMVGNPMWMILICPTCSNVQLFRPDLVPEATKKWKRQNT
jgi:tRNA A-37 threonylcarbamoyl transferase component Bud32